MDCNTPKEASWLAEKESDILDIFYSFSKLYVESPWNRFLKSMMKLNIIVKWIRISISLWYLIGYTILKQIITQHFCYQRVDEIYILWDI